MKKVSFEDLKFKPHFLNRGGVQAYIEFSNGYGASVVCTPSSYGGPQGLYELGVLHGGNLTYDTDITSDVLGYLSEDDVTKALRQIESLDADGHLPSGKVLVKTDSGFVVRRSAKGRPGAPIRNDEIAVLKKLGIVK